MKDQVRLFYSFLGTKNFLVKNSDSEGIIRLKTLTAFLRITPKMR